MEGLRLAVWWPCGKPCIFDSLINYPVLMKKLLFLGLALASLTASVTACSEKKEATGSTTATTTTTTDATTTPAGTGTQMTVAAYTCPMHPKVLSDKPGSCLKCGMDLVKK